jgi:hypothetical protein
VFGVQKMFPSGNQQQNIWQPSCFIPVFVVMKTSTLWYICWTNASWASTQPKGSCAVLAGTFASACQRTSLCAFLQASQLNLMQTGLLLGMTDALGVSAVMYDD